MRPLFAAALAGLALLLFQRAVRDREQVRLIETAKPVQILSRAAVYDENRNPLSQTTFAHGKLIIIFVLNEATLSDDIEKWKRVRALAGDSFTFLGVLAGSPMNAARLAGPSATFPVVQYSSYALARTLAGQSSSALLCDPTKNWALIGTVPLSVPVERLADGLIQLAKRSGDLK